MAEPMLRHYRRAVALGLLGGAVVIYLALVGIVERFETRNILAGVVTLGITAPAIALLIFTYRATRPPAQWTDAPLPPVHTVGSGLFAGLAGGALAAAFVLL